MSPPPTIFTPQQRLLLQHFLHTRGIALSRERIIAVLYGDDYHGGPDDAASAVRKHIQRLRERLEPHGVAVLTMGFGAGAEGWLVDPEHLDKLGALLAAAPGMAIEVARARVAEPHESRIGDD